jgi:hypothetical protein
MASVFLRPNAKVFLPSVFEWVIFLSPCLIRKCTTVDKSFESVQQMLR